MYYTCNHTIHSFNKTYFFVKKCQHIIIKQYKKKKMKQQQTLTADLKAFYKRYASDNKKKRNNKHLNKIIKKYKGNTEKMWCNLKIKYIKETRIDNKMTVHQFFKKCDVMSEKIDQNAFLQHNNLRINQLLKIGCTYKIKYVA